MSNPFQNIQSKPTPTLYEKVGGIPADAIITEDDLEIVTEDDLTIVQE